MDKPSLSVLEQLKKNGCSMTKEAKVKAFIGYVSTCQKEPSDGWMIGLAQFLTLILPDINVELHDGDRFFFNGKGIEQF